MVKVKLKIIPDTPIVPPRHNESVKEAYIKRGFWDSETAEHIDRFFLRNADGQPIILQKDLEAVLKRVDRSCAKCFRVVGGYLTIKGKLKVNTRAIIDIKTGEAMTSETYEFADWDNVIEGEVEVDDGLFKQWLNALAEGGKTVGMGAYTRRGYGRFKVQVQVAEEKPKKKAK